MGKKSVSTVSVRGDSLGPVLLLLLIAVAVPTACVLWFMTEAMQNERLAVRQRLTAVYESQLAALEQRLHSTWMNRHDALASAGTEAPAPGVFADLIAENLADSVIVYDTMGRVVYPSSTNGHSSSDVADSTAWVQARRLEFETADPAAAAEAYEKIARQSTDVNLGAHALQAQARCLVKDQQISAAITVLSETLDRDTYRRAVNTQGRFIAPSAQLWALQLIGDPAQPRFGSIANQLVNRLSDYTDLTLPADQRRFLMRQLVSLTSDDAMFPTLDAEDLAALYIDSDLPAPEGSALSRSGLPGVWQLSSPDGLVLGLYKEQRIFAEARAAIARLALPEDVSVELLPPGANPSRPSVIASLSAGTYLSGWRVTLHVGDLSLFDAAAAKRVAAYLWTGVLVIVSILTVAIMAAGVIRRNMRLTSIKNDLVATVTHELKTPIASTRMLVDTLLGDETLDEPRAREYLRLIAKENTRLSHLIDNFLTFSRMQRNKRVFKMAMAKAGDITNTAVEAAGDKFHMAGCRLDVEVARDLPTIMADSDALVTVVMNLLDNAYKYTEEGKHIVLRTYASGASICFEVQDNGIGLSRRAAKRVFDRFYQADQRLSRAGGGCGLGLSIVQSIVTAHGGSLSVESEPGSGSTFTVRIPVAPSGSGMGIG